MKATTFYLTPELKEKRVPLCVRNKDGNLELFDANEREFENDPEKGGISLNYIGGDLIVT